MVIDDEVLVRPAEAGDVDRITEIYLTARSQAPMPPPVHPPAEVRTWLATKVDAGLVWVCESNEEVRAFLSLTPTWLDDLYVDPVAQRQGLGALLLDLAKSLVPTGFCLWVFESNRPARDFYLAHGLIERERTDGSDNEERSPDIRMCWPGAAGV